MAMSGEMIRMLNYIDDISTTLRRIVATSSMLTEEEKKQLAEYMRKADPNYIGIMESLARGDR
jgi:hypothetical protein